MTTQKPECSVEQPDKVVSQDQSFLLKHRVRADCLAATDVGRYFTDELYLKRPDGRIAYSMTGEGPLAICLPGMGDVRSVYRFLGPTTQILLQH